MEFGSQSLSFGDFSSLSEEEHRKVFSILHRPRPGAQHRVEFPWDNTTVDLRPKDTNQREAVPPGEGPLSEGRQLDETSPADSSGNKTQLHERPLETKVYNESFGEDCDANRTVNDFRDEAIQFLDNCPPTTIAPVNQNVGVDHDPTQSYMGQLPDRSDSSSSGSGRGSSDRSREVTPTDGNDVNSDHGDGSYSRQYGLGGSGRLLASMKPYERRNKKKRPPGYYEKVAQEETPSHGHNRKDINNAVHMYSLAQPGYDGMRPQHPMVPPPTTHQPPILPSPMVMAGGNYGNMHAGMLPVFPVPPGYPIPAFQGGVPMPMHPSGLPLIPGHLQQQHGMMALPPQPHMPPAPVNQGQHQQHVIPMADLPGNHGNYPRVPMDSGPPIPIVSQDIRQHPPGFGPAERSRHQIIARHGQHVIEDVNFSQYGGRRASHTERMPPDGREMSTNQRFSEPPAGSEKHVPSPPPPARPVQDEVHKDDSVPVCLKEVNAVKIDTDLKQAPSIAKNVDYGLASNNSREVTPIRTKVQETADKSGNIDDVHINAKTNDVYINEDFNSGIKTARTENSRKDVQNDTRGKCVNDIKGGSQNASAANSTEPVQPKDDNSSEKDKTPGTGTRKETKSPVECAPQKETVKCDAEPDKIVQDSGESETTDQINVHVDIGSNAEKRDGVESEDSSAKEEDSGAGVSPAPVVTAPPVAKPAGSWAGLFKGSATPAAPVPATPATPAATASTGGAVTNSSRAVTPSATPADGVKPPVPASQDSAAKQLGELLYGLSVSFEGRPLQPRGLMNRANWCYVNATLQALLACPAFTNLLKSLPNFPALTRGPSSTPILDSLVEFVHEFIPMQSKSVEKVDKAGKKRMVLPELTTGSPFEPANVYKMLQVIESSSSFKGGKQEDAEEFLSCVLNGLHEEMAAAMKEVGPEDSNAADTPDGEPEVANGYHDDGSGKEDDQWEQVGPRNKSVFTRKANFAKTPVSDIFAGQIRSAVFQAGSRESAMLEPFFTLQLDIQGDKVYTVKDALEGLVSKEAVQGFTCSKTKAQVEVTRRLTLEELPPVLILHLKFFIYQQSGGCQKLLKKVDYATELEINRDLLSPNVRSKLPTNQRMYKLFAVVYHHGKTVTGGHYTTDVYHPGISSWVHIDDSSIRTVNLQQVLKFVSPRVPYLLYYRRMDSM